jgi:hypothetical protein
MQLAGMDENSAMSWTMGASSHHRPSWLHGLGLEVVVGVIRVVGLVARRVEFMPLVVMHRVEA